VLDEPTTKQDRGHLNKFMARMKMLNEAEKTIILISHDMGVVAEYASRTIVMKDGAILMDAGTRGVFSQPDILEEASIEPHLLARACNDVRRRGCSGATDCWGTGAVWGVRGELGNCFLARCIGCERREDWVFVNIDVVLAE
jgi:energy-coupling factor transport system ATP-binding protein